MTDNIYLQPAFVLQHRPFQESCLIVDVLTHDYGRFTLIAKGVRKPRSKTAASLQPFVPLLLSCIGKTELKTLTGVDNARPFSPLQGTALYCGFYVNELVMAFLHAHDPHPEVFVAYNECLSRLGENTAIEKSLRIFELDLLDAVGYGLQLDFDHLETPIRAEAKYHYNAELGFVAAIDGRFAGTTLLALKVRDFAPTTLTEAKFLMRAVVAAHLPAKPLKSRAIISKILTPLRP